MSWLRRLFGTERSERASARAGDPGAPETAWWPLADDDTPDVFVCSTCGRTDLPETGGWDPPICQECDAAINFDAILESEAFDR